MGYIHIQSLYKDQTILLFRRCWALEKVHGTSAHVTLHHGMLSLFSGSESPASFAALFDKADLSARLASLGHPKVTVYGEAYGGRCMGMRQTYGNQLRFIAFDVQIGGHWLSVPDADQIVSALGLEFVPFGQVSTDLADLDQARDARSVVAQRRGCGDRPQEGVVLRPLVEVTLNSGSRVIAKHKCEPFSERATPQKVVDQNQLVVLSEAQAIAQEWVTRVRLIHVIDKLPGPLSVSMTQQVVSAMVADVYREAAGEVVESREARQAIGRRTAQLFHDWLRSAPGPVPEFGLPRKDA